MGCVKTGTELRGAPSVEAGRSVSRPDWRAFLRLFFAKVPSTSLIHSAASICAFPPPAASSCGADAENIYDELKNQWVQEGEIYHQVPGAEADHGKHGGAHFNWWTLYGRMFDGEHHREAVTSRTALLDGVAR